jgi:hypothetical protein
LAYRPIELVWRVAVWYGAEAVPEGLVFIQGIAMLNYVFARVDDRLGHRYVDCFYVVEIRSFEFVRLWFFWTTDAAKAIFELSYSLRVQLEANMKISCSLDIATKVRLIIFLIETTVVLLTRLDQFYEF